MQCVVIMAGGSGTRLWPMSRKSKPKQLHNLVSDKTLIQETYDRVVKVVPAKQIFVSTTEKYVEEIRRQLPQVEKNNFIVEPASKNTAPALGFIALAIKRINPDAIISTIASDHIVHNTDVFANTVRAAFKTAQKYPDHIVAVGINPTYPETGLGYIKMGKQKDEIDGEAVFVVNQFTEKPDLATAKKYLQGWEYQWNAAYYFFKAKSLLSWIEKYRPKTYKKLLQINKLIEDGGNGAVQAKIREIYSSIDEEQIENAVIEQKDFKNVLVIPADLGWSDIGNWGTLHDVLSNRFESSIISRGHHIDSDSENCLVYAGGKMTATLGLKDVIIVDTPDVLLIANKNKAQDVKKLIDRLKEEGKHLYL